MAVAFNHIVKVVWDVASLIAVAAGLAMVIRTICQRARRSRWLPVVLLVLAYAIVESIDYLSQQMRLGATFERGPLIDVAIVLFYCVWVAWALLKESKGSYWAILAVCVLIAVFWAFMLVVAIQHGTYNEVPCSKVDYSVIGLRMTISALAVRQLIRCKGRKLESPVDASK